MALSRLVIVVLQLAAFATSAATPQVSLPANIEIDVIFPRQGETYAPVSPFPVVFAIQNAAVAWSFGFAFEWLIHTEQGILADIGTLDISSDAAVNPLVPPADPYLLINQSVELSYYPNNALTLGWQFTFFGNCTENADGSAYTLQDVPFNAQGRFNFSTAYGGKAVDVLAGGQCPALGSIVPVQSSMGANCPHIADSGIQPSPCAFTIDAAVASSVSAAVVPTTTAEPTAAASGGGTGTGSVPTQTTATGASTTMSSSAGPTTAGSGSTSTNTGVRNAAGQGLTAVLAGVVAVGVVVS
jgi:hypothetical protein